MNLPLLVLLLSSLIKIVFVVSLLMLGVMMMILAERKVSGWIQDRHGPNRVGPWGVLQPLADGVKFMMKEEIIPSEADKPIYLLAPALCLVPAMITCAVVPFGNFIKIGSWNIPLQIAELNIGILYILAITSLGVYGIVLGAWASNNKYSLLGGLRASAQMLSYELSLGLSIIGILLLTGSLSLREIALSQGSNPLSWNFLTHFPAFLVFTTAMFAETNRLPFDLAEAEQELVAGYHTEYSSMKFAMFFMAEYMNMIVGSAVTIALFFGGWQLFGLENLGGEGSILSALISFLIVLSKTAIFLFIFIWVRWSLPRFRYDQLMNIGWKILVPIAFSSIVTTATVWSIYRSKFLVGVSNLIVAFVVVSIVATGVSMRQTKDDRMPSFMKG